MAEKIARRAGSPQTVHKDRLCLTIKVMAWHIPSSIVIATRDESQKGIESKE